MEERNEERKKGKKTVVKKKRTETGWEKEEKVKDEGSGMG